MKSRASIATGFVAMGLALLTGACSSGGSGNTPGSGGAAPTGSGGAQGTGTGGAATTGSGGDSGGVGSGGASNPGSGGDTGSGSGGSGGSGTGTGGNIAPGSGGRVGTASGGAGPGTGGAGPGTGGAGTGTGGAVGTGGSATPALPRLVTSGPSGYWQTAGTVTEVTAGTAEVTVNDASMAQTWDGFGGAFNEMGWNVLSMLSAADRENAIRLLFGNDGARFNLARIPIGASDYGMDRYTLDETANDTTLANFSISRDMMKLIPYIKAALAVRPGLRLYASPWTPPTWMKMGPFLTGNMVSPFDGGTMKGDDATLQALATYFVKFVQEYAKQNITVEAVAPQNEPNYQQNYPSCVWAPATYTKFIGSFMGPAFTTAGLTTKIMLGTMSNPDSGKDMSIVSSVMGDPAAKGFIKVIGMQWGMIAGVPAAKNFGVPIWQTEHKCGNYPWMSGYVMSAAPNNQAYAVESWGLIRDWVKAGVTAYNAWNMVLDTVGKGIDTTRDWAQNALLTVDTGAKKLNITPAYYVFRHVSQYVEPGAKVVATTGGDALAFKNPNGTIVTIMYNSGAAKTTIVSAGGKKMQFMIPATGWATVTSQ